ncbi:MAG: nitroreductase family protein [Desulfatiglans sp.]|jgi:nitroreductase|nr:nitroreductase family protein [Thermodesulfobacteriota bacterium]MEE4354784.1 nitroreductase family protein [Desulfatiglans sp.]
MEFKDVITKRRAVNFFDPDKPVSQELLRKMVETAALSPSGFNLQPWSLMVLRDQEEKMRLRKLAWDQPKVSEAPVTLIVLADRDGWKQGHPFFEKNFKEMVESGSMKKEQYEWFVNSCMSLYGESEEKQQAFACKNTGFFTMALMMAARDLGLDTHPMDGFDHEGVREAFHIPKNYWIPLLMAVGYFDQTKTLHPPKWRKTFDEIVIDFKNRE